MSETFARLPASISPRDKGGAAAQSSAVAGGELPVVALRTEPGRQALIHLGRNNGSASLTRKNSSTFFQPILNVLKRLNRNDKSFYLFNGHNSLRRFCVILTAAPAFGKVVLTLVFLNCITLAMDPGPCDKECRESEYMRVLFIIDAIFTGCFTLEILFQAIAHCFILGPSAYLHDGWNWIDLLSTATGYVAFLPMNDSGGGLNGLRGIRAMRPLRALRVIPGLRRLVECLLETLPLLLDVLFLLVWVFFAFGIIGLNVFMGALRRRCAYFSDDSTSAAMTTPNAPPPLPAPPWPLTDGGADGGNISNSTTQGGGDSGGGGGGVGIWNVVPGLEDQPCNPSGSWASFHCPVNYESFNVSCQSRFANPNFGFTGFDHFGLAVLNIFVVMTLDGWNDLLLYPLWATLGPGLPVAVFSLLVLFGAFFAMQLVVAIMSSKFAQLEAIARNRDLISRAAAEANLQQLSDNPEEQNATTSSSDSIQEPTAPAASKRSVLIRIAVALFRGITALVRRYSAAKQALRARMDDFRLRYMQPVHSELLPPWRRRPYIIVHHETFVNIMTAMILVNTAALGMDHYGISSQWAYAIDTINNVLTYIFIGELVLKHVAVGFVRYWTEPWDILDGLIVAVSLTEIIMIATGGGKTGTQALRTLRVLRILRALKLLRRIKSLHRLIKMVLRGFAALGNFLLLTSLFIFIFSLLGLQQFGGLWSFQPEANTANPAIARSNFNTLWESAYTVFQILTCDDWLTIAWNGMRGSGDAALLYFVAWVVIGNIILLSLFLAILITTFTTTGAESDAAEAAAVRGGGEREGGTERSAAAIDSRQQQDHQGSDGNCSSDSGGGGGRPAGGGGRPDAGGVSVLRQRVAERVSERLEAARVKVLKRWLVMIGETHGITAQEVASIVWELDARVDVDADLLRFDKCNFDLPFKAKLDRQSAPLSGMRRDSTLRRRRIAGAGTDGDGDAGRLLDAGARSLVRHLSAPRLNIVTDTHVNGSSAHIEFRSTTTRNPLYAFASATRATALRDAAGDSAPALPADQPNGEAGENGVGNNTPWTGSELALVENNTGGGGKLPTVDGAAPDSGLGLLAINPAGLVQQPEGHQQRRYTRSADGCSPSFQRALSSGTGIVGLASIANAGLDSDFNRDPCPSPRRRGLLISSAGDCMGSCRESPNSAALQRMASAMNKFTRAIQNAAVMKSDAPPTPPVSYAALRDSGSSGGGASPGNITTSFGKDSTHRMYQADELDCSTAGMFEARLDTWKRKTEDCDSARNASLAQSPLACASDYLAAAVTATVAGADGMVERRCREDLSVGNIKEAHSGSSPHLGSGDDRRWLSGIAYAVSTMNPIFKLHLSGEQEIDNSLGGSDGDGGGNQGMGSGSGGQNVDSGEHLKAYSNLYGNPLARRSSSGSCIGSRQGPTDGSLSPRYDAAVVTPVSTLPTEWSLPLRPPFKTPSAAEGQRRARSATASVANNVADCIDTSTVVPDGPWDVGTTTTMAASSPSALLARQGRSSSSPRSSSSGGVPPSQLKPPPYPAGKGLDSRRLGAYSNPAEVSGPKDGVRSLGWPILSGAASEVLGNGSGGSGMMHLPSPPPPLLVREGHHAAAVAVVSPFIKCISGRNESRDAWKELEAAPPPPPPAVADDSVRAVGAVAFDRKPANGECPEACSPRRMGSVEVVSEPLVDWTLPSIDIVNTDLVLHAGGHRSHKSAQSQSAGAGAVPGQDRWDASSYIDKVTLQRETSPRRHANAIATDRPVDHLHHEGGGTAAAVAAAAPFTPSERVYGRSGGGGGPVAEAMETDNPRVFNGSQGECGSSQTAEDVTEDRRTSCYDPWVARTTLNRDPWVSDNGTHSLPPRNSISYVQHVSNNSSWQLSEPKGAVAQVVATLIRHVLLRRATQCMTAVASGSGAYTSASGNGSSTTSPQQATRCPSGLSLPTTHDYNTDTDGRQGSHRSGRETTQAKALSRTRPGPVCEGLFSERRSTGRLATTPPSSVRDVAPGTGSTGLDILPDLPLTPTNPTTDVVAPAPAPASTPRRRFLRTATTDALATTDNSPPLMDRRVVGLRGLAKRSLHTTRSLFRATGNSEAHSSPRQWTLTPSSPPWQRQPAPPTSSESPGQPESLPGPSSVVSPMSNPPPPRQRLIYSATSRPHRSMPREVGAATGRYSGSGVASGGRSGEGMPKKKFNVARARQHGPKNATEEALALFAALRTTAEGMAPMPRPLGRNTRNSHPTGGNFDGGFGGGDRHSGHNHELLHSPDPQAQAEDGISDSVRLQLLGIYDGIHGRVDVGAGDDCENAGNGDGGSNGSHSRRTQDLGSTLLGADTSFAKRSGAANWEVAEEKGGFTAADGADSAAVRKGVHHGDAAAMMHEQPALSPPRPQANEIRGDVADGDRGSDGNDSDADSQKKRRPLYYDNIRENKLDPPLFLNYPSLGCIGGHNRVRRFVSGIILHRWFDYGILAVILVSSAILAVDSPRLHRHSPLGRAVALLDYVFTAVFTTEMLLKVVAKGLVLHPYAYLRNGWDVLDATIVATSLVSLGLSLTASGDDDDNPALRLVRLARALRPLRLISRIAGMRRVVETLIRSLPSIGEVMLFGLFQFGLFGILGVQLFAGKLSVCSQREVEGVRVQYRTQCVQGVSFTCSDIDLCPDVGEEAVRWWGPPMRNFDHLGSALLTLFTVITLDGYMDVARSCMDAVGLDRVPETNHAPYMGLYVLAFVFLGSFFWVNLFVSVIIDHYASIVAEEGELLASKQAKEYVRIFRFERNAKDVWKGGCPPGSSRMRVFCWKMASSPHFDTAVTVNICINIVAMAAVYYNTPRMYDVALALVNVACTCGFAVEAWLKIVALGWRKYLRDNWNKLDLFIIAVSVPDIVSTFTPSMSAATGFVTVLRLLRVVRMFKLIKNARGLRILFNTLISSAPAVANVASLLLLVMYIYAVIGMNIYGGYGSAFDKPASYATYNNIGVAMTTQFRLFTGDGWGELMGIGMGCDDNQYQCDTGGRAVASAMFFCSFVLVAIFVMLNLVIAVVMDNFIDNAQAEGLLKTTSFVDVLRMVISLRGFVVLMRHKIDALRERHRATLLTTANSNVTGNSQFSRIRIRRRSRALSTAQVSINNALASNAAIASDGVNAGGGDSSTLVPATSGTTNQGSTNNSGRRRSSDFIPWIVGAMTHLGLSNSGHGSGNGHINRKGSVGGVSGSGGVGVNALAAASTAADAGRSTGPFASKSSPQLQPSQPVICSDSSGGSLAQTASFTQRLPSLPVNLSSIVLPPRLPTCPMVPAIDVANDAAAAASAASVTAAATAAASAAALAAAEVVRWRR